MDLVLWTIRSVAGKIMTVKKQYIYISGIIVFGIIYYQLKSIFDEKWVFALISLIYLVALRTFAEKLGK